MNRLLKGKTMRRLRIVGIVVLIAAGTLALLLLSVAISLRHRELSTLLSSMEDRREAFSFLQVHVSPNGAIFLLYPTPEGYVLGCPSQNEIELLLETGVLSEDGTACFRRDKGIVVLTPGGDYPCREVICYLRNVSSDWRKVELQGPDEFTERPTLVRGNNSNVQLLVKAGTGEDTSVYAIAFQGHSASQWYLLRQGVLGGPVRVPSSCAEAFVYLRASDLKLCLGHLQQPAEKDLEISATSRFCDALQSPDGQSYVLFLQEDGLFVAEIHDRDVAVTRVPVELEFPLGAVARAKLALTPSGAVNVVVAGRVGNPDQILVLRRSTRHKQVGGWEREGLLTTGESIVNSKPLVGLAVLSVAYDKIGRLHVLYERETESGLEISYRAYPAAAQLPGRDRP